MQLFWLLVFFTIKNCMNLANSLLLIYYNEIKILRIELDKNLLRDRPVENPCPRSNVVKRAAKIFLNYLNMGKVTVPTSLVPEFRCKLNVATYDTACRTGIWTLQSAYNLAPPGIKLINLTTEARSLGSREKLSCQNAWVATYCVLPGPHRRDKPLEM